jgi:hypothetical protein
MRRKVTGAFALCKSRQTAGSTFATACNSRKAPYAELLVILGFSDGGDDLALRSARSLINPQPEIASQGGLL